MAAQSNWSQAAGAEVGEAVGAVVASAPHLLLAQPGCAHSRHAHLDEGEMLELARIDLLLQRVDHGHDSFVPEAVLS